ncbi:MAG: oligosaccharide flippase family protein [Candidatus Glassbacteria bacterium]|nr:oligosaccharide flippase family protein [Candidatus Glassbacteria bacterium]
MTRNFILMLTAQGLLALLSYILNLILTRYLPMEEYGQLRYVISITSILIFLTNPGLSSAVFKCVVEGYHRFVARAYRLTLKYSLWGSLILFLLSLYFFGWKKDPQTAWLTALGAVFFPAMFLDRWIMVYLAKGLFARARTLETAVKLASIVLAGCAAFFTGKVITVMICMFLAHLVLNPLFAARSLKLLEPTEEDSARDRKYVSYSTRLTLYTLLPNMAKHLDKILIASFLDFKALSLYYIATIVPLYFQSGLKSGINVPVQNWVSQGKTEALKKFSRNQWIVLGLSVLTSAALYIAMPLIISLFGNAYQDSAQFAQILCLSFIVYPYTTLFFMMLTFLGEERFTGLALNVHSLAKTLLFLLALPYYGITGIVCTQVLMDFAWFGVAIVRLRKLEARWFKEAVPACPAPAELEKQAGPGDSSRLPDTGLSSEDYTET